MRIPQRTGTSDEEELNAIQESEATPQMDASVENKRDKFCRGWMTSASSTPDCKWEWCLRNGGSPLTDTMSETRIQKKNMLKY